MGEIIEAWLLKRKTPSIKQVFDNCNLGIQVDKCAAWERDLRKVRLPRLVGDCGLQYAYHQAKELAASPRYIDSHCWVFNPHSFLNLLRSLTELHLLPFKIESFAPTQFHEFEFFVQLRPHDPSDSDTVLASIDKAIINAMSAEAPKFASP